MSNNTNDHEIVFEAFPAPRGWQFGGDIWSGSPHQVETTDFLPAQDIQHIEISIIRKSCSR